jgi:hypothetical protein
MKVFQVLYSTYKETNTASTDVTVNDNTYYPRQMSYLANEIETRIFINSTLIINKNIFSFS